MRYLVFLALAGVLLFSRHPAWAQQETPSPFSILSPQPGQALQGNITITGSGPIETLRSAELSFGYSDDPTHTWFFIAAIDPATYRGKLAEWDTSTLTDGDYILRLVVTQQDGNQLTLLVAGLRVRNYTAIETNTPTPPLPTDTPAPGTTIAPTATRPPSATPVPPSPTALPPNPAQLTSAELLSSGFKGLLVVAAAFGVIGFYILLRRLRP